jgi:hypothetical protein
LDEESARGGLEIEEVKEVEEVKVVEDSAGSGGRDKPAPTLSEGIAGGWTTTGSVIA